MTSQIINRPPLLNGNLGNYLPLPKPPPNLGSESLKGAGKVLKGAGTKGGKIAGGTAVGLALELLFPPRTARSGLDELPKGFFDTGTGKEIDSGTEGNEPIMNGNPGTIYTLDVEYTIVNNSTGESTLYQRGSYVSYGSFGLVKVLIGSTSQSLHLIRSLSSGATTITVIVSVGSNSDITNFSIVDIRTNDPQYAPPNDREDNVGYQPTQPPTRTSGGIVNLPEGYTPPPPQWGGYTGATTNTGDPTVSPISKPPDVGSGVISGGGVAGQSNTGSGAISGGQQGGTGSQGGSLGGGTIGGTAGGTSQEPLGIPGGVIGGNTTGSGSQTLSPGGTTTGTGVGVNAPSETAVSSPTNTGTNTASVPNSVPIKTPTGTIVGNIPMTPGEQPTPGSLPFPPVPGLGTDKPGEITKPNETDKPTTKTPKPPEKEPKDEKEKPKIIPIPFDLNAEKCCTEAADAVKELSLDLECVIEKICTEDDEIVREFLRVTVVKDPYEKFVMNTSTNGLGEQIVVAGYMSWIVQGTVVAPQIPIRRRTEMLEIPEWAEGWEPYPCNGAEFLVEVVEIAPSN